MFSHFFNYFSTNLNKTTQSEFYAFPWNYLLNNVNIPLDVTIHSELIEQDVQNVQPISSIISKTVLQLFWIRWFIKQFTFSVIFRKIRTKQKILSMEYLIELLEQVISQINIDLLNFHMTATQHYIFTIYHNIASCIKTL